MTADAHMWFGRRRARTDARAACAGPCHNGLMAVGRAERRKEREPQVGAIFGTAEGELALDLLDIVDLAWHDCYGDVSPPRSVIEDMITLSDGTISGLIKAAQLGLTDWRDLKLAAEEWDSRT